MDIKPENVMFDSHGVDGVLKVRVRSWAWVGGCACGAQRLRVGRRLLSASRDLQRHTQAASCVVPVRRATAQPAQVIDLGSAEFVALGQEVPHAFGTVRYSSPEMAAHSAGPASDVWSAGILLFQALSGRVPFLRDSDLDTLQLLRRGPEVKMAGAIWRHVSAAAKDCIRAMLTPDPLARPTAEALLRHPWLAASAPGTAISTSIVHQLQVFAGLSRARRVMLGVAAKAISGSEASRLVKAFLAVDRNFNGTLEFAELAVAAKQVRVWLRVCVGDSWQRARPWQGGLVPSGGAVK
jgi:serine/threonine protein kinase